MKLVVCVKQVPAVSEVPWDAKTGTLKREAAEGMMNPACKHALEAALWLKADHDCHITVVTMGPPMAEEVLYEAAALGADRGILLSDERMAGADTFITSLTIARAIRRECPDFDLILCGAQTSDSETAQVGPQLAEDLAIPGVAYVEQISLSGRLARMQRLSDSFLETLEMNLPGLITVSTRFFRPRHVSLAGVQDAFDAADIVTLNARDLGFSDDEIGLKASPTRIIDVYSPVTEKRNSILKGAPKKVVDELLNTYADKIGGAMAKDITLSRERGDGV